MKILWLRNDGTITCPRRLSTSKGGSAAKSQGDEYHGLAETAELSKIKSANLRSRWAASDHHYEGGYRESVVRNLSTDLRQPHSQQVIHVTSPLDSAGGMETIGDIQKIFTIAMSNCKRAVSYYTGR